MALSPSYRVVRILGQRTTGYEGTNFEPQCLAQFIGEENAPATLYNAAFPGWYTLAGDVGVPKTLYCNTAQENLLLTFGRMCAWNLKLNFTIFYYDITFPDDIYVPHTRTININSPLMGPVVQMPDINEKMLPNFIYPRIPGTPVPNTVLLETLPIQIFQQRGTIKVYFKTDYLHSQPITDPTGTGLALIPQNTDFNGSSLFNSDNIYNTNAPVVAVIRHYQDTYFMSPQFSIFCDGQLDDGGSLSFGWSNPSGVDTPGRNSLGQLVESHGTFRSPLGTATGIRFGYPATLTTPALTLRVDQCEYSAKSGSQCFFEFLDVNGQNPVWNAQTGAQLIFPVPLTMDT